MTKEEYKERLDNLQKIYDGNKLLLIKEFVFSNAKYKSGDIIQDQIGYLKISKVGVYIGFGLPEAIYYGMELNKDFTPSKKQTNRPVYETNTIKI